MLACGLSATALAAPTVSLSPTFAAEAHLGEGSTLSEEVGFAGTEYGAAPLPLTELTLRLPKGTALSNAGFPTCPLATLKPSGQGPQACPKGSGAGPVSHFTAIVSFGRERTEEPGTLEPFFSPEGGLFLFFAGHDPVSLEILATAKYVSPTGSFGPSIQLEFPLIETVPGAPDTSLTAFDLQIGASHEAGATTLASVTAPTECSGSMAWEALGQFSDLESPPVTASKEATTACLPPTQKQLEEAAAAKLAEEAKQREALFKSAAGLLGRWLTPHGKRARISALLKHGGYVFTVHLPPDTKLSVAWYQVPKGAHLSAHRPVLLATGKVSASASGSTELRLRLTETGRKLLQQGNTVKVTERAEMTAAGLVPAKKLVRFRLSRG